MIIYWCEICNNAPADGILEVLRRGETQTSPMHACLWCVDHLEDTDWIENAI
jgi:hypothetical protein